jgi:membrane-associated phospholipid phosphatase
LDLFYRSLAMQKLMVAAFAATAAALLLSPPARSNAAVAQLVPRAEGWLVKSYGEIDVPAPPKNATAELKELEAIKRTPEDVARFHWWAAGGPVYRWNEIILGELLDNFVTLPLAARHLALFHAALDDAVAVSWYHRKSATRAPLVAADPSVKTPTRSADGSSFPSDHAAAATTAAEVLGYIFPARAAVFAAMAEEAMQARLLAGVEYPSDVVAGRAIGQRIAALAIARGKSDQSEAKWTGSVPEGPGRWNAANPIAPLAGTWQPWVLARADEFRPSPPPAFDSDEVKAALAELKAFPRTPKSNHRAIYWEVYGGARAHALWNETARLKLLEYGEALSPQAAARAFAALNIAFLDAAIACWDAKYAYWYIRPSQLDSDLKTLFPSPNHPSYPAAHGCLSTAAATVLAAIFPHDRSRLLAYGKEAAEARIWAGIHYRFDIDAGQAIGRKVAEKTLQRAFVDRAP